VAGITAIFMAIPRCILLRIGNVLENKLLRISKHIICSVIFFLKSTFYKIIWKIMVESDRPRMTIKIPPPCWNDKRQPDAPLGLGPTPSLGRFNSM